MSLIQDAIQSGLAALRPTELGIQTLATYTRIAPGTYNVTTGVPANTVTPYANVPTVFTGYSKEEIDGESVLAQDLKAIIATLDLIPTPTVNDRMTRADGSIWSVMAVTTDPAGAAWVLQVRRP